MSSIGQWNVSQLFSLNELATPTQTLTYTPTHTLAHTLTRTSRRVSRPRVTGTSRLLDILTSLAFWRRPLVFVAASISLRCLYRWNCFRNSIFTSYNLFILARVLKRSRSRMKSLLSFRSLTSYWVLWTRVLQYVSYFTI